MALKSNTEENQTKMNDITIEEEYDEDLEEFLPEEETVIEEYDDYHADKSGINSDSLEKITDNAIKKNISSCLICGEIIKWFMFIMAFIYLLIGISVDDGILAWLIVSVTFILSGVISSMMLKWFGYTLKCLYDIKMK